MRKAALGGGFFMADGLQLLDRLRAIRPHGLVWGPYSRVSAVGRKGFELVDIVLRARKRTAHREVKGITAIAIG